MDAANGKMMNSEGACMVSLYFRNKKHQTEANQIYILQDIIYISMIYNTMNNRSSNNQSEKCANLIVKVQKNMREKGLT